MADFQTIGQSHIRVDALDKVTGKATYAGDVYLPGMLMCKLLVSSRSHARIIGIDTSAAEELPACVLLSPGETTLTLDSVQALLRTAASWRLTRFSTSVSR